MLFKEELPFKTVEGGLTFLIKVSPKASKNAIGTWASTPSGLALKVFVTQVPEKGEANEALLKLLSDWLDLPKSSLSIIQGSTSRLKTVCIRGSGPVLMSWLRGRL